MVEFNFQPTTNIGPFETHYSKLMSYAPPSVRTTQFISFLNLTSIIFNTPSIIFLF